VYECEVRSTVNCFQEAVLLKLLNRPLQIVPERRLGVFRMVVVELDFTEA
jgi:hypothetical protein